MLETCERLIYRIAEQIRCTSAPIHEILTTLSLSQEWATCSFLQAIVQRLADDGEFSDAWCEASAQYAQKWELSERERDVLTAFAGGLGKADIEGECRYCEQYAAYVRDCRQKRYEELPIRGRLYTVLSVCISGAVALLLL